MRLKIVSLLVLFLLPFSALAQDVTTFLGIPVDGTKSQMRKKIIAKGFSPKMEAGQEYFSGEFNGVKVDLFIGTNNKKVYRIMLCDVAKLDEANIKVRFNNLVSQFEKNKKYISLGKQYLSDYENISYEMNVNNKIYQAVFYQVPDTTKLDFKSITNEIIQELSSKYTKDQLNNPSDEIKKEIASAVSERTFDIINKKTVWFKIESLFGMYFIVMYYDNGYNQANGEDL